MSWGTHTKEMVDTVAGLKLSLSLYNFQMREVSQNAGVVVSSVVVGLWKFVEVHM